MSPLELRWQPDTGLCQSGVFSVRNAFSGNCAVMLLWLGAASLLLKADGIVARLAGAP
jgi:phosphatidylserine synthase